MNPNKRKADEDEESCDTKGENETANVDELNSEKDCGTNSVDEKKQKSDNGGSSDRPGTSDNDKKSEDDSKVPAEQLSEHREKKPKLETSKTSGTLLFAGGTNWDQIGRKTNAKNVAKDATGVNLWGPHRLASLQGIKVTGAFSGCCAVHTVIVTDNGQAYTWGRNDKGQLGHGDTKRRDIPTLVETLKNDFIVSASCGRGHTLLLNDKGIVSACGDNKMGQCGIGSQSATVTVPTKISFKGRCVASVACGAEFSMILTSSGAVYSFGLPEFGQLGHNSDGRYFLTASKLAFRNELTPRRIIAFVEKSREGHVSLCEDVHIVNIACGINHTVALDTKGHVYSWGFGGYGRLGHSDAKDEFIPRLIKTFDGPGRGVKKVYAGGTYSIAVNIHDVLYFFGQNKRSGEPNTYPKPVPDLVGWSVKHVACSNTSIVVVADDTVISWGPSPTYGELAYGDSRPKSSTTPQEVKPLAGVIINALAMGYGHTVFIARDETDEDRKKLEQFPEYTP